MPKSGAWDTEEKENRKFNLGSEGGNRITDASRKASPIKKEQTRQVKKKKKKKRKKIYCPNTEDVALMPIGSQAKKGGDSKRIVR